jgi:hypothetical protein
MDSEEKHGAFQDCDIVHIMNMSQFVPFVRRRAPRARIVLHMHCQWLERFNVAVIEQRINSADLVLDVSNFIATGVRRRFPSSAIFTTAWTLHSSLGPWRPAALVPSRRSAIGLSGAQGRFVLLHHLLDHYDRFVLAFSNASVRTFVRIFFRKSLRYNIATDDPRLHSVLGTRWMLEDKVNVKASFLLRTCRQKTAALFAWLVRHG